MRRGRSALLVGLLLGAAGADGAPDDARPALCLVAGDPAAAGDACGEATPEALGGRRPVTVSIDVPVGRAADPTTVRIVGGAAPRTLRFSPVARDPGIADRRFARLDDRARYRLLTGDEAGNYRPLWHPSGRYLVWRQIGDLPRLWCLDLKAAAPEPRGIEFAAEDADELFGDSNDGISHFEWLPGSTTLVVRLTRARKLRRVALEGCRARITVADDLPEATDFAFSPDGRWLVWRPVGAEALRVGPVGGEPIGALCGDGADPSLRTAVCRGVRWRPDGDEIAFWWAEPGRSGGQQVVVAGLDRRKRLLGRPQPVEAAAGQRAGARKKPAMAIAYSPSGAHLAFVSDGRIHIADTAGGQPGAPRTSTPLSIGRGRYNSNKSDIVWLDTHHIAAVVDGTGGRHPVVVAHVDPERRPTVLSRVFPTHYDLAWDPVGRRLAVSAFSGQQGIFLAEVQTAEAESRPAPEYYLTLREAGATPVNLTGPRPRHDLGGGLDVQGRWDPVPGADRARLTLTFVQRKTP